MNEKEILIFAAVGVGLFILLKKKPATSTTLLAQQQAAAQAAALAAANNKAMPGANGTGALVAGIGEGLGALLKGIGSLTGGGSGTNKENGGNYTYEPAKVVDEYDIVDSGYSAGEHDELTDYSSAFGD